MVIMGLVKLALSDWHVVEDLFFLKLWLDGLHYITKSNHNEVVQDLQSSN
jgi:hypothetical protein